MPGGRAPGAAVGLLPRDGLRPPADAAGDRPGGRRSSSTIALAVAGARLLGARHRRRWRARGRRRSSRCSPRPTSCAALRPRHAARATRVLVAAVPRRRARAGLIAQASLLAGDASARPRGRRRDRRWPPASRSYTNRVDQIVTRTLYPAICAVRDRRDLLVRVVRQVQPAGADVGRCRSASGWRCSPPTSCISSSAAVGRRRCAAPGVRRDRGDQPHRLQLGRLLPRAGSTPGRSPWWRC